MLSPVGLLLLMSGWAAGHASQLERHHGLFEKLALEKRQSVIPEPIGLARRNGRRPLHFDVALGTPATAIDIRPLSFSAETWIVSSDSPYCESLVCNHGTFNQQLSSTYNDTAGRPANASIAAIDMRYGGHGFQDTVMLGGMTAENMSMNLALESSRGGSVLGLGYREPAKNDSRSEASFSYQLLGRGFLSAAAYSVWLGGPDDKSCGSMLFGAVDHSKYVGTLWMLRTHGVVASAWGGRYIALSGLSASSPTGSDQLIPADTMVPVQLVFGDWANVLPPHLASLMWRAAGARYDAGAGAALISCDKRASAGQFHLQLGGPQGPVFAVGMQLLVVPGGQTGPDPDGTTDDGGLCAFNVGNSTEPADWRLGDNFLRAAYALFDPQRGAVAVAPIAGDDGTTNFEALDDLDGSVSGSAPVPGQPLSLTVPLFSSAAKPTKFVSADGFERLLDSSPSSDESDPDAGDQGLSVGIKAAIGVGVALGTLLLFAFLMWYGASKNFKRALFVIDELQHPARRPAEMADCGCERPVTRYELGGNDKARRAELPG